MSFNTMWDLAGKRRTGHGLFSQAQRNGGGAQSRRPRRASKLALERLEDRIAMTAFLVVNALDGPGDGPVGSLRYEISRAEASGSQGSRIVITPQVRQSIALTAGEISIGTSLSILNNAGHAVEILQTTPDSRVFDITDDSSTSRIFIGANSSVNTLTISGGNLASGNGGGILDENPDSVITLTHVHVVGNSAGLATTSDKMRAGGGIYTKGQLVLDHSMVGTTDSPNQTAGYGGGVWAGNGLIARTAKIVGNQAGVEGGGTFVTAGDTVLSHSQVNQNTGLNVGGIYEGNGAVLVVAGSQVNGNSSTSPLVPKDGDFGGGGIAVQAGKVFVSHSEVNNNVSIGMFSSGIVILFGGVTIDAGSQVNGNINNGPGGGIAANFGGTVTVTGHSQVDHNTGSGMGGGIVNFAGANQAVVIEKGSEVSDNTLTNKESLGDALIVFLEYIASLLGSDYTTLTGGVSPDDAKALIHQVEQEILSAHGLDPNAIPPGFVVAGGGIGTLQGASVIVQNGSRVDGNYAGLRVEGGNDSSVGIGGGVATFLSQVQVDQSQVAGNTASEDGGGIWNRLDVSITRSSVAGNTGIGETLGSIGGGLFLGSSSAGALIANSSFSNNSSEFGGGVFNLASLTIRGSNVSRNRATKQGGGIADFGQVTLDRSVVTRNTASLGGGGIVYKNSKPTLVNSRVVHNTPDDIAPLAE